MNATAPGGRRDPGWEPDPTGRYHYRYWDGLVWTDHVSDGEATGTDVYGEPAAQVDLPLQDRAPGSASAQDGQPVWTLDEDWTSGSGGSPGAAPTMVEEPATVAPAASGGSPGGADEATAGSMANAGVDQRRGAPVVAPVAGSTSGEELGAAGARSGARAGRPDSGPRLPLAWVLGAVAVLVAGLVIGALVFGDDDAPGVTTTVSVPAGGVAVHDVEVSGDQVVLVSVTATDPNVDPVLAFHVDPQGSAGQGLASYFGQELQDVRGSPLDNATDRPRPLVTYSDRTGEGVAEAFAFPAPAAGTVTVVVGDNAGLGGKLKVWVSVIPVEAPTDPNQYQAAQCASADFADFDAQHSLGTCER